jgi:hypothetical protein
MPCVPEMPEVYAEEYKILCIMSVPTMDTSIKELTLYNSQSYKRRWYASSSKPTSS